MTQAGSMIQREPGVWRLFVSAQGPSGRKRVTTTVRGTRAEARKALRALVAEHNGADEQTFGQLMERWLEQVATTATPSTLAGYRSKVRGRIIPTLGALRVAEVTPKVLEGQYAAWLAEGLAPATVRQCHDLIRAAWQQAVRWGEADPGLLVTLRPPRVRREDQPTPEPPSPATLAAWIARAADQGDALMVCAATLAATTGMRRGELVALRWSDVDIERRSARVARSITRAAGTLVEGGTKAHRERLVALDQVALDAIRARQSLQRSRALEAQVPLYFDPFLLSESPDGTTPLSPDVLSHRWHALCGGECRFHDLRHWAGTQMGAAGVPVRAIMARLGHAQLSTVLRYTHAVEEADRHAALALGAALGH